MAQRAILYARVSTARQAEHDLSIPDQIAHGERYCAERGLVVVGRYIDAGASARDDNRPEFQRMIADIKAGGVVADLLLVHSFSRFFRDSFGSAFYGRILEKHGMRVTSMTQEVGEDSSGGLMRTMLSAFDEYSSLETAKHVRRSMLENAKRGFWNGSVPPFGYRTVIAEHHGGKAKKKLAIEPAEAEIVRRAFQLYLYGDGASGPMGVKTLTAALNAAGFAQRSGAPFRVQSVHLMLTRSAYVGAHYFNRRDSRAGKPRPRQDWVALAVPRILDDETFYAVQAQLNARNPLSMAPRLVTSDILLSGVARCGRCGGPMRTRTGKGGRYWYYACARKADIGESACAGCAMPMQKLDDLVADAICERVLEPARLGAMLASLLARSASRRERQRAELRDLTGKQRALKAQLSHLLDALENGALAGAKAVQQRFSERQDELEALGRLIAHKQRELGAPLAQASPAQIEAFSQALRTRLRDKTSPAFRRSYLRLMLDKVVVASEVITISGPKSALAQQLAANNPLPPSSVPTFAQDWRTRQDSNL